MLNRESRGGWQRSLPLPDLSRKIEGPLLAGYTVGEPIQAFQNSVSSYVLCCKGPRGALINSALNFYLRLAQKIKMQPDWP